MLNKLSIKGKMTLLSAIVIFVIFMVVNLIQLFLIQTFTTKQEEDSLWKRSEEIQVFLAEQEKYLETEGKNFVLSDQFLEKIVEDEEMVRILDQNGQEIVNISNDFPELNNEVNTLERGFSHFNIEKDTVLLYRSSLDMEFFHGTIIIGRNEEVFEGFLEKVSWTLILGTILSLVLSIVSGRLLAGKLLSPLRVLTNTMKKIEGENFAERVPVMETNDEFSQLSLIFNRMMDKVEASMIQQRKFVGDASHELRTPLAIIHGHLSLLKRWGKNDKEVLDKSLNISINETKRMIELTKELLWLSQFENHQEKQETIESYLISDTINEIVSNYLLIYPNLIIHNEIDAKHIMQLAIPEEQLRQLLIIIIDNAIKYSGENKEIIITSKIVNDKYRIDIQDNGVGISKEDIPHIFDRFYRVDKARSRESGGSGLGLSIAKEMIEEYEGTIQAESIVGEGTKISLVIPYIS
ncbi:two-component sensor histidine kinase [Oceanobacillus arenosus]|uniref:Signal transduction histidine-protein kinase ArlS n=1 Tax=Oceanobacillus arenosus TaxID=1229153 RepID=A0A3D8Q2V5_9BACI|nr:ATP-binding protein [Oceanobacillus arenosus]RDW22317.1 two-component sensor histidine kinase [Oceanobacillus arenosus]